MKPSIYWLLAFVPITVMLEHAGKVPPPVIFFSAALAIVPIAVLIVRSTEQIATRTGDAVGGLLNATFGNAPELIIALVALRAGYPDMVRASIIGAILANLLLALGIAFFLGGLRHRDQNYNRAAARIYSSIPRHTIDPSKIARPAMRPSCLTMETVMKTVFALAITWTVLVLGSVTAAQAAPARANRITIAYVPPKNSTHQGIYERLKEVRFLEKLQELLSPVRLPRPLRVKTEGCDGDANAFYADDAITICYEYVDELWKNVPAQTTPGGGAPIDALLGPLIDTCLHEFGHAVFDMLRVPTFGREEDAADQVSAYIMLHLGKAEARRLFLGIAYAYKTEFEAATAPPALKEFSNVHGTPAQRFYNLLCIAYGADAQLFGDLVAKGYLPKERAEDCEGEYKQVAFAFQRLISPHIDARRARKVFDKSWLPEPTRKVQRRPGLTQPVPQ